MRILFSHPAQLENEVSLINNEMSSGNWQVFHLRKPDWTENEVLSLFNELLDEVQQKTVLHKSRKISCHSFEEVDRINDGEEYCFLSPVFDSISKTGYHAKFDKKELRKFLKKERKIKVIGLGGVTEKNFNELLELGFDGGAFLGSVWKKHE